MEIKNALPTDAEKVFSIAQKTILEIYPRYYPLGAVAFFSAHHSLENIRADLMEGNVFLLWERELAVGTVTLKEAEISRLFVLPRHQGKGYGGALLDFSEERIGRFSDRVRLDASLPAKAVYHRRGYREVSFHSILTANGDYLCYDLMEKRLFDK